MRRMIMGSVTETSAWISSEAKVTETTSAHTAS